MLEYIEVGRLNKKVIEKIKIPLITDQVIFTFERLEHVEDRRKKLYEGIKNILPVAVYAPDYIYRDWNNRDNTLVFIKSINESSKICIIIKIAKLKDEKHCKKSLITT